MRITHSKFVEILAFVVMIALFVGLFAKGIYGANSWQALACMIIVLMGFSIRVVDIIFCYIRNIWIKHRKK